MGGNETKTQVPVFKTPMGKLARCGTQVLAGVGIPSGVAARWAQLSPAPKTALCPSRRHTGWRWRSGSRLFRLPGVGPKLDFSLRFPAGKAPGGPPRWPGLKLGGRRWPSRVGLPFAVKRSLTLQASAGSLW